MKKQLMGLLTACALGSGIAAADTLSVKQNAPERYTVKKGDTLWDISSSYLNSPWRWPEIWAANKHIQNPHLIYPGNILLLCNIKGQAVVAVDQGGGCAEVESQMSSGNVATNLPAGDYKLKPQIRSEEMLLAIPTVPLQAIQRYMNDSRVVSAQELQKAPYVMAGAGGAIITGEGSKVYVRDKEKTLIAHEDYGIYRGGVRYDDPDTGEVLGFEATAIGAGTIIEHAGQVGTMDITRTIDQEVRIEDKLLAHETRVVSSTFTPSNPADVKPGRIVRIFGSIAGGANYSVIVINRGERDGVKQGHTFAVSQRGKVIKDRVSNEMVKLPSEHAGHAMVFRIFDKVSYALVLDAKTVIKVGDEVKAPLSND